MKISELLAKGHPLLSFEVFPPKSDDAYDSVKTATEKIAGLRPAYMSVTYGAGGGTSEYTLSIAENILKTHGVPSMAHLTCASSDRKSVEKQLRLVKEHGVENVLALRGDLKTGEENLPREYMYASQLVAQIKEYGGFCIGGACYPEGHVESPNQREDILHLREKVDAGCEFLVTQMFFDNNILYNFLYKIREAGIKVPVVAGIMPVTNAGQIKRMCALSGASLPQRFKQIVDTYGDSPDAMKQAGIAYATDQIIDLYANGVNAVHVYSMNKPDVAEKIMNNLSCIIGNPREI